VGDFKMDEMMCDPDSIEPAVWSVSPMRYRRSDSEDGREKEWANQGQEWKHLQGTCIHGKHPPKIFIVILLGRRRHQGQNKHKIE